ncbi:hypothetical protein GH733_014808 [Mirounga leonina]|nr:hypothetical protein GH733_014808 [Mirounga leonina]
MGALHCRWYPCTRRFQDWDCGVMSVSVSVVQILRGGTNDNRMRSKNTKNFIPFMKLAMDALDRVVKPKTKRAKRFLENREPKLSENTKNAILCKGEMQIQWWHKYLKCKNITRPFEDQTSLEFFSKKSDCSLFMFGFHNKKWPNNLVIGLMFDYHVLDMIELGIEKFVSLKDIKNSKCPEGTKPVLIFAGDDFVVTEDYRRIKSLLTDFFRGPTVPNICLAGLENVLHFTALNWKIYFRSCKLMLENSGCRTPRIELEEMGALIGSGSEEDTSGII